MRLGTRLDLSLIPRPFPPPVFDRLQYAKRKGNALGTRLGWPVEDESSYIDYTRNIPSSREFDTSLGTRERFFENGKI